MVYSALYEFCETLLMVSCFSKFNRFLHSSCVGSKQYTPKGKTRKYDYSLYHLQNKRKINYSFFRRHIVVTAHCSVLDESIQRMSSYLKS